MPMYLQCNPVSPLVLTNSSGAVPSLSTGTDTTLSGLVQQGSSSIQFEPVTGTISVPDTGVYLVTALVDVVDQALLTVTGTEVSLTSDDDLELVSVKGKGNAQAMLVTPARMERGKSYKVKANSDFTGVATAAVGLLTSVTVSSLT